MVLRRNVHAQAEIAKNWQLFYVHCVSNEDFILIPKNFACVEVVCREIHVSLPECLSVRRVALTPSIVNGHSVQDMFENVRSPALVHVDCSCDFKVRCMYVILREYHVLSSSLKEPRDIGSGSNLL